ncbi:MAG TPA: hypothetical protein PKY81_03695 [bacterium]|nr:hypothetical protein [bacterium]HPN30039.1 hypothetical protein [bacterium]
MSKKIILILSLLFCGFNFLFAEENQFPFQGFLEYSISGRLPSNDYKPDNLLINELRGRIEYSKEISNASFDFKFDIIRDEIEKKTEVVARVANISYFPSNKWEIKAGRQILTWGTGDLVFVNDLFPKDWNSFFSGRQDEYLKAPLTAVKTSFFLDFGNIDFVVSPAFESDIYITGERMSYWGPAGLTGQIFKDTEPANKLKNAEFYFRFSKNISNAEFALYSFKGFMKRPLGYNQAAQCGFFPKLAVHGLSVRKQMLGGIAYLETGYYDSIENRKGDNFFIENSMIKSVAGFEKEIKQNLTAGIQYFSEYTLDYSKYKKNAVNMNMPVLKEHNHDWITLRLTNLNKQQTLALSLFGYYSPSENDCYLRPSINYKNSDQLAFAAGFNIFSGKKDYTFFGQLEDNSNAYFRISYSY